MASNNSWARMSPHFLSLLRIVAAFLFMCHGADKLFNLPGGPFTLISSAKLLTLAPGLAGILEFGGGFLLLIGLFSRPIAFILSGEMAFAYFLAHFPTNHIFRTSTAARARCCSASRSCTCRPPARGRGAWTVPADARNPGWIPSCTTVACPA
jgi:uncharacterized membrane protein YphA (DoxX/SURF4 family)